VIKYQSDEIKSLKQIIEKQNEKLLDVNEDLKLAIKQIEQVDKYFQSLEVEETETELHPSESDIEDNEEEDESEDFEVDSNYTEETESETESQIDKKEMDEILDLLDDY